MRSPDIALTNTEKTNALGAHTVVSYMDTITPTVVATALINQASITYPLTVLTVDGTVGWVGVKAGMDVYVGTTPGAQDIGVYRVKSSDATHLTIGETGQGDAGLLIVPLRSATFADNQYLTVVQRRSIWSVLPLISGANFYEDYNTTVGNFNAYPPPVLSILCALVSGARQQYNHLWTFVDDGQAYAEITFTVAADAWPGTSVAAFAWTVPGSWTVTGGSVATATFTAQVPAQAANYELLCVVTNNHGVASTRVVEVWVKARTGTYAPLPITALDRVTWDTTGPQIDFTLNDNLLANLPDGSMVVIAQERFFNGATIASAVTQVVGWITRIGQKSEPGLRTASPQFVGVNGLLNLKRGTSQVWAVATSITTWQQVPLALCTLSFAQFWLLSQRARGVLELFDFIPVSLTATDQRLPRIDVKMGTPWSQLVNLADGYQKRAIACDPDGTLWVRQPPSLNPTYPRTSGAVVVRDTHDASIYHDVNWPRELYPKVGVVEGSAFMWDGASATPTPLLSLAPGFTPGQGGGDEKCENQVVDSQATLNTLTGNYFASLNPDYPEVTVNYEGMRGALVKPAQRTLMRIQIPDYLSPSGVALDRYAMPVEVNETYRSDHNGGLVVDTSIRYVFETAGVAGATKDVPVAATNPSVPIVFPVTPVEGTVPIITGAAPTEVLAFAATEAKCTLFKDIVLGVGASTIVPKNTGLSGIVTAFYTPPWDSTWDSGLAFGAGGVDYATHLGTGFTTWVNRQSLTSLFGVGATTVLYAFGSHLVNGWGVAQANNGYYAITHDNFITSTRYAGTYESIDLAPHDANVLVGVYRVGRVGGVHWGYVQYQVSTDGGVSWSNLATNDPDPVDNANELSAVSVTTPYTRPTAAGGGDNTYNSSFVLREVGTVRNGGSHGGHFWESRNKATGFTVLIDASGYQFNWRAELGRAATSTHTWKGDWNIWASFDKDTHIHTAHTTTDDGATIHASASIFSSVDDDYLAVGFNGWPRIGTSDPDVAYWLTFAASLYSVASWGNGGIKLCGDNGASFTELRDPSWTQPDCNWAECRLAA